MVYPVTSRHNGLKILDNNNNYEARLHTILENDHISVCKSLGEHNHLFHPSESKVCQAIANIREAATNSQSSRALIINYLFGSSYLFN